jgi:hypothetical protein
MGAQSTVIKYYPIQTINSATFTGSYLPIGSPTIYPSRIFKIVNDSSVLVFISTDGVTNMDVLPPSTFVLYDVGTNKGLPTPEFDLPPTQFYASGVAGTGSVYVVTLYANTPTVQIPL